MSLATVTQTYESKAKSKAVSSHLQPVLKTVASQTRENRRTAKDVRKDSAMTIPMGWEYFLNPLEFE